MLSALLCRLARWTIDPRKRPQLSRRREPRFCPRIEALEDRCLLSVAITSYAVPPAGSTPLGIVAGPDGNLWFTELLRNRIGEINPATHAVADYAIPTAASLPFAVTPGPDGDLWFTESNKIGAINPTTHAISEYLLPTNAGFPVQITSGPDGNIWFTEEAGNQIGTIDLTAHAITEYPIPTVASSPGGISTGPDGRLWFTESDGNNIAALDPTTHSVSEYPIPTHAADPLAITVGPDGNLWFTEHDGDAIGRLDLTTFVISEYVLPQPAPNSPGQPTSGPSWIAAGPDGNLWFTESNSNKIGTINPATHAIAEYPIGTAGAPVALTVGPGGTLWFTELKAGRIGEILISPTITASPKNQLIDAGQTATFTASASDGMTLDVQWLVSTDHGKTFKPLKEGGIYSGTNTATLSVSTTSTALNGYEYKAVFSNSINAKESTATAPATLTVKPALSMPLSLPQGAAGENYHHVITISGGVQPYTTLTVTNFDGGATGLTASAIIANVPAGTATIQGMPAASGTVGFTVTVTDQAGATMTQNLTLTINYHLQATDLITQWTAGKAGFMATMHVSGGTAPYSVFGAGHTRLGVTVQLNGNTITFTGTPSAAAHIKGTMLVTDAGGAQATPLLDLTINPPLAIGKLSETQWTVGQPGFTGIATVSGGTPSWHTGIVITHASGLPTGLTPVLEGQILSFSGTPTMAGTFRASITIQDLVGALVTKTFSITIDPVPTISNPALAQWTVNQAGFSGTMTIAGGTGPFGLTAASGLPTGLTAVVRGRTISFTGTPTVAQAFANGSITIQDVTGAVVTETFSITINSALAVSDLSNTQWTRGASGFAGTMTISGGTGPYHLIVSSGLPAGVIAKVNGSTISFSVLSKIPKPFTGTVTIRDAAGASLTKTFSVTAVA